MDKEAIAKMIEELEARMSLLNKQPCKTPSDRCLEPARGKGWGDLDPASMDAGCAAYWHISMAVNELRRMERIALAVDNDE